MVRNPLRARSAPVLRSRRALLGVAALLTGAASLLAPAPASAQAWPAKTIRILVGFPAGSTTDTMARALAEHMRTKLGQPVVVENRPGANGVIGVGEAARAAPDGYTLLATNSSSITVNPQIYRKLPYQTDSFAPVSMVVSAPFILTVNPANERVGSVKTVKELVELARERPGQLTYGSGGPGNLAHLTFAMLGNRAGVKMTHVPYKGAAAAQLGILSKEIDTMFDTQHGMPNIKAGKVRPIAVTSASRLPELPDVPTMAEAGFPGFEVTFWLGLLAPAGTPEPILQKIHEAVKSVRENATAMRTLEAQGQVDLTDPKAFAARIREEAAAWGEVIRRENIQLD